MMEQKSVVFNGFEHYHFLVTKLWQFLECLSPIFLHISDHKTRYTFIDLADRKLGVERNN